jgi:predicted transcriptional regulator
MNVNVRTIEVDAATADWLEARAAERGVSVAELLADIVAFDLEERPEDREAARADEERPWSNEELAELDRRWAAVQAGELTIPHEEVVRWLQTWGTPAFRPWAER